MGIRASGKGYTSLQPTTPISVCPTFDTVGTEAGVFVVQINATLLVTLRNSGGHTAGVRPPHSSNFVNIPHESSRVRA